MRVIVVIKYFEYLEQFRYESVTETDFEIRKGVISSSRGSCHLALKNYKIVSRVLPVKREELLSSVNFKTISVLKIWISTAS